MSQENVEIVRNVDEALNRGDWDVVFRDAHENFELTTQLGPDPGTRRGRERVMQFLEDYLARSTLSSGARSVFRRRRPGGGLRRTRALPRGGNVDLVVRNGWWWTIRDGVIRQ